MSSRSGVEFLLLLLHLVAAEGPVHAGEGAALRIAVVAGVAVSGRALDHVKVSRGGAALGVEAGAAATVAVGRRLSYNWFNCYLRCNHGLNYDLSCIERNAQ